MTPYTKGMTKKKAAPNPGKWPGTNPLFPMREKINPMGIINTSITQNKITAATHEVCRTLKRLILLFIIEWFYLVSSIKIHGFAIRLPAKP